MLIAVFAILITTSVVGVHSISLKQKEKAYAAREQELLQLIAVEEARARNLRSLPLTQRQKSTQRKWQRISWDLCMKMRLFFRRSINVAPLLGESHITVLIFVNEKLEISAWV